VSNTGLLGRWQVLGVNPAIVCDTGHNLQGVADVVKQIEKTAYKNLHVVWGMVSDKDVVSVLKLLPQHANYYFARPDIPRGLDAEQLLQEAKKVGLNGECYTSVLEALKNAKKISAPNDLIFIGGSTFVVAEVV
jgi:dihydrofolate synthase/folylpolyglutamate synthase